MKSALYALAITLLPTLLPAQNPSTEIIGHEKDYTAANAAAAKAPSKLPLMPAAEVHPRGGLPKVFAKLARGGKVTVAYYGGSITAGPGWRTRTHEWLTQTFPNAQIEMVNAAVGGSGSLIGVFRADADLVAKKPDLVFIEFSLNDGSDVRDRPDEVTGALEGIARKLRNANPDTDICMMYTVTDEGIQRFNSKKLFSNSVSLHEHFAAHYTLPSIHLGIEVAQLVAEGKMVFKGDKTPDGRTPDGKVVFTHDGSHPSEEGHRMNGEAAVRGLEALKAFAAPDAPRTLPAPISALPWEKAKTVAAEGNAEFSGDWAQLTAANGPSCRRFGKRFYEWFPHLFRTATPGASMTVRFKGTHIGFKGMEGPDSGVISIQIDDGKPMKRSLFTVYANQHVYVGAPLPSVPDGIHTATWTLLDETPPKEELLKKKNVDADFRNNPAKYKENAFSVGQIIVMGDIVDAQGNPKN
jgi:lysophospholipase L1-like esterase